MRSSRGTPRTRCCRSSARRARASALTLCAAAHVDGWAFPRGGSQALVDALAARLVELGGEIATSSRVDELPRADAVLCDVAPSEFARLARLPRYALGFRHGPAAFKLDWALDAPIPWASEALRRAATVHLGGTFAEIAESERAPWEGRGPGARPFVLLVQQSLFDDSRAPAGKHTAWAYCHVPNRWDGDATDAIEAQVERFAPGFRELILARHVMRPRDFEAYNAQRRRRRHRRRREHAAGSSRRVPRRARFPGARRFAASTSARRRRRPAAAFTASAASPPRASRCATSASAA